MLILELIRASRRPIMGAAVGIVTVLGLRFLIGPLLHFPAVSTSSGQEALAEFLGAHHIPNVPFSPIPWLVFPLQGFILGWLLQTRAQIAAPPRRLYAGVTAALSVLVLLAGHWMSRHGFDVFRWGTISIAFLVIAEGLLGLSIVAVLVGCMAIPARIVSLLSLRGVTSLALVPIHYMLINAIGAAFGLPMDSTTVWLLCAAAIVLSFLLSNAFARLATAITRSEPRRAVWVGLSLAVVALLFYLVWYPHSEMVRSLVQLVLCVMLVMPSTNRSPVPTQRSSGLPPAPSVQ